MIEIQCKVCDEWVLFYTATNDTMPIYATCDCGEEYKLGVTRIKRAKVDIE